MRLLTTSFKSRHVPSDLDTMLFSWLRSMLISRQQSHHIRVPLGSAEFYSACRWRKTYCRLRANLSPDSNLKRIVAHRSWSDGFGGCSKYFSNSPSPETVLSAASQAELKLCSVPATMVLINININVFNVLKFIVLEILIAWGLQPAWELIISRTAHARLVNGERVTLAPLPKSRTFPCALSTGSVSGCVAIAHSLLTLGGSLASEYAVDSVQVLQSSNATAQIYSRAIGWKTDENSTSLQSTVDALALMVERCYYRDEDRKKIFC